jgi:hypothetical protein
MGFSERFLFTAWFRHDSTSPDEEDHEWPACFEVLATSAELASHWGLHLTRAYLSGKPGLSLRQYSIAEQRNGMPYDLPVVVYGSSDLEIGWQAPRKPDVRLTQLQFLQDRGRDFLDRLGR